MSRGMAWFMVTLSALFGTIGTVRFAIADDTSTRVLGAAQALLGIVGVVLYSVELWKSRRKDDGARQQD